MLSRSISRRQRSRQRTSVSSVTGFGDDFDDVDHGLQDTLVQWKLRSAQRRGQKFRSAAASSAVPTPAITHPGAPLPCMDDTIIRIVDRWQHGTRLFLEPFTECASTLKIAVGHRCTCSCRTLRQKADNKKTELTRQTSAAVFHNFCLDDHEISTFSFFRCSNSLFWPQLLHDF